MHSIGTRKERPFADLEKPFDVSLGAVEVRRRVAQGLTSHADEDVLLRQPDGKVFGRLGAELELNHVPRPPLHGHGLHAQLSCLDFDAGRKDGQSLDEVCGVSVEDLPERR